MNDTQACPAAGEELQHHFELALSAANMGTFEWCPETGDAIWDKTTYEITGIPPHVAGADLGAYFFSIVHPEDYAGFQHNLNLQLTAGQPIKTFEFRIVKPFTHEVRWVTIRSRLYEDAKSSKVIGVIFDNTDVIEARNAITRADQAKGEFLAMLSHELRSPLAPIVTALHVLDNNKDPEVMTRALDVVNRQMKQLQRLTDELLDVTRISSGRILLRTERVDLTQALSEALESSQAYITQRGHTVNTFVPKERLFIDGDYGRLVQVFTNIIQNAAKYTPDRGTIEVELHADPERVHFVCTDNGPGIPNEVKASVFNLFEQIESQRARSDGGLGVGLALVKRLVELHQGTARVTDGPTGIGCRFIVTLPRKARQSDVPAV